MKNRALLFAALLLVIAGLTGCSRTVDDVAKWETEGDTEELKTALTDPKYEVRQAAAESLGNLKVEDAVDVLAACLNDPEEDVQLAAIDALSAIGTDDITTPMIAAFKLDNTDARLKAAKTLGNLKSDAAAELMVEALDDPNEDIRLAACKTLAEIGGPLALKALTERLADSDERLREEAMTSLLKIGRPAVPAIIGGLKSENIEIRTASITILRGLGAVPTKGDGLVWYQLARASLSEDPEIKEDVVTILVDEGDAAVPTLLEAAAIGIKDMRDPAVLALDNIGLTALEAAMEAASQHASNEATKWMEARTDWAGAPSPLLDLFAAVAALNPDFSEPSGDQPGRKDIPALINQLDSISSRAQAVRKLKEAGPKAYLPLIAAIASTNTPIAETVVEIVSELNDPREFQPLMDAVQMRVDTGEALSQSPLYSALVKQNNPEAEPLILKIRPNTERALSFFTAQYRDARVVGAETSDLYTDNEAPITFRIGYTQDGNPGTLEITFKKDSKGNWRPSPALPYKLPE